MPGIVGLVTRMPRERAAGLLDRMVETLCHQSFDRTGTFVAESLGLYVGWSAHEGSFAERMPVSNERGDVLVFSGEEYPEPGTAARLKAQGHSLDVGGPSYLVHLAEEEGNFPAVLNGRFHGLLIDAKHRTVTLFNDRYGLHRLYYHESPTAFYFAAEAKAILQVCPELRTVDARGVGEFIACGCVLENRTIFNGISVLPPASTWLVRDSGVQRKSTYFTPHEWEQQPSLAPERYYEELRAIFSRNLSRYFAGDQPVGISLTGGLDSRMIMAWQKSPPGSMPCYSFGGPYRECRDVQVARQVARACGQPYEVISLGEDFLSRFAHYAERTVYLSDGCVEVNYSPDLYVNAKAREISPIRMTGNYGGEVLRRVRAFKPVEPAPGLFTPDLLTHIHGASHTFVDLLDGHPLSFAVFRQAPWHHHGLLALEETQLTLRSPYLDNEFVRMVFRAPDSVLTNNDICLRLIADGNPELRRIRTDRGLAGGTASSMALRRWLDLTFKAEYAFDYGMPQWAVRIDRRLSLLQLERLFLGRHKFKHFRVWYRDRLSAYVRDMLLDPLTLSRPYVDRGTLEAMVLGHLKGDHNFTLEIHKVLTLELIHRLLLERPVSPASPLASRPGRSEEANAVTTLH